MDHAVTGSTVARDGHFGTVNYREVTRKLAVLGCTERQRRGGGSHRKWFNPKSRRGTVLPDWGGRDLKTGTIRNAIRQLDIDWRDFEDA